MQKQGCIPRVLLAAALVLILGACLDILPKKKPPQAVDGILDLTTWDLGRDGPVDLAGNYEFYWMQHLTPEEFEAPLPPNRTGFIRVPGYWNNLRVAEEQLPGTGYATYRLTILLNQPQPSQHLAIKYLEMSTAFRVYVNSSPILEVGSVGQSKASTTPRFQPGVADFTISGQRMEIIFHVSNFDHRRGGSWEAVTLGLEEDIRGLYQDSLGTDLFLFGSFFIMGLYHLGLFTLRMKDRIPLYFCVICLLASLRLLTTGERYLIHLVPDIDWELMTKLEYLSFYLAVPVFVEFMQALFLNISKWFLRSIWVLGSILSALVVFTTASVYSHTLPFYQFTTVVAFMYGFYIIVCAALQKKIEAFVVLAGFVVLALAVINDILHVERIIQTQFMTPFGLFILILFQAFFLSFRFSRALQLVEMQRIDLRDTLESYKIEIIERVEADAAVRSSHERLLNVLDSINADIYVIDLETHTIIFMNQHMRENYGNDLVNQVCWEVIGSGGEPCNQCMRNQLFDTNGKPRGVCTWEERHPVSEKWYMRHSRAISWDEGRFALLQVATDISALKQAEIDLRESEEKYRSILESIEEGYYEVDLSGNLTFCNESLCHIFGYSAEELLGMNNQQYMSAQTADQFYRIFNRVYRSGAPAGAVELEAIRKDGQINIIEISVSLKKDAQGRSVGFRGIARDITERKKTEELAKLHQHQLMQASKMVAIGTLVSGVAHEINNPNNFIMLNSSIVRDAWESAIPILEEYYRDHGDFVLAGSDYSEMRDHVLDLFEGICDGAQRIKQIVYDLKSYVREDTANHTQDIDINAVIESAVALLSHMIKHATTAFTIDFGRHLPCLRGNFQRLEQVIINLIQNACQALADPGKAIVVRTRCDTEQPAVIVHIEDQGCGMSTEILSAIMDPFFTTKGDTGGIGLGLSIAYRIVEEHGGHIHFTSEQGSGTIATVVLPTNQVVTSDHGEKE